MIKFMTIAPKILVLFLSDTNTAKTRCFCDTTGVFASKGVFLFPFLDDKIVMIDEKNAALKEKKERIFFNQSEKEKKIEMYRN